VRLLKEEEERFSKTIDRGSALLEEMLGKEDKVVPGEEAFNLYATFGFPIELTSEIALERGKSIDMEGFVKARKAHEEVSSVNKFNVIITGEEALGEILKTHGATKFTGYELVDDKATIVALLQDGKPIESASEGEEVDVVLDHTPFYAESGGQLGDGGILETPDARLLVLDTKKHEGLHLHRARTISGTIENGQVVSAHVDKARRNATMLHHSTAHVFHAAAREIFGKQVVQAGSQVGPNAMRFDFTLDKQPGKEDLGRVETLMNEWVHTNSPVVTKEMSIDEAKATGAIAMFGEKYGDRVRVVSMGDFSLEFCGGTHVGNVAEIGQIKIISEGSVAQGTRRVEALSGPRAWNYISEQLKYLGDATDKLKVKPADMAAQIERLQFELKAKEKAMQTLEEKLALGRINELLQNVRTIGDCKVVAQIVPDAGPQTLKTIAEALKNRPENLACLLIAEQGTDNVSITVAASAAMVKNGFNSGKVVADVASLLGGKGGGRPDLASAGGKEPAKMKQAIARFNELVDKLVEDQPATTRS
jgi:alanyl-tRNA synthetase